MRQLVLQIAVIALVSLSAAGMDGAIRGLSMPKRVTETRLPASRTAAATTPAEDELGMTAVELHDAWKKGEVVLIDARLIEQYREGHIPDAYHLPFEAFQSGQPELVSLLDPSQTYVIYCEGGDCHASHNVASMLAEYGFEHVLVFARGYPDWVKAGFETQAGDPPL
ncbi:rhodanese-like domain-containing protein [Candidatus Poribacteria bacterium]|nr:rhodanese-like domain-containing protein [Candidatus Poribacteria bacterium]